MILSAVLIVGVLLISQTSVRTMAANTGGFLAAIGAPLGRAAKSGISNISTLNSDRQDGQETDFGPDTSVAGEASTLGASGAAAVYDFAAEGDDLAEPEEIAAEIMANLQIAMEEMEALTEVLQGEESVS